MGSFCTPPPTLMALWKWSDPHLGLLTRTQIRDFGYRIQTSCHLEYERTPSGKISSKSTLRADKFREWTNFGFFGRDLVETSSYLGRISNLRPFLDSSAQTTLGKVLDFFRKISKRARYVVFEKRCFPEGFQAQNRRFELKSIF